MPDVEDHHLGRAPRLAATFDLPGVDVQALHEAERTARLAAAREKLLARSQRRKVHPGARAILEDAPFFNQELENALHVVLYRDARLAAAREKLLARSQRRKVHPGARAILEDAPFFNQELENALHVVLYRVDEARGTLRLARVGGELGAHVEPHRRVERRELVQHQEGHLVAEVANLGAQADVPAIQRPLDDGVDHAVDQLLQTALPRRAAQWTLEELLGHDLDGGIRPVHGEQHVLLLEDHLFVAAADHCVSAAPFNGTIHGLPVAVTAAKSGADQ